MEPVNTQPAPVQPTPGKLPPWASELLKYVGLVLAMWLAAKYGITLPAPQPQSTPGVLVLNVSPAPAQTAPIQVAAK